MTNAVEIHKLDQGLFAIFDDRGSIRFASVDDPELVKFKTSMESQHETEEVFPLLQHSERQALMRDPDFQVLKFEIEALTDFVATNPYLNEPIFSEEQVLDVCLLRVDEGILLHVISQYGHLYSLLLVPQISARNKVALVVSQVATRILPAEMQTVKPLEARLTAPQSD